MVKFKFITEEDLGVDTRKCDFPGCDGVGEFKAPLSRECLDQHQWLCKEHITEFNKGWDYFNGMSQQEIEAFQKDAVTGHRPTWHMADSDRLMSEKLQASLNRFMGGETFNMKVQSINQKDRKALSDLELEHPSDKSQIKKQYKKLVKKYHPDANPNNKKAEERFKEVTASYNHLMQDYADSIQEA